MAERYPAISAGWCSLGQTPIGMGAMDILRLTGRLFRKKYKSKQTITWEHLETGSPGKHTPLPSFGW